jgi:hypothetical protein
MHKVLSAAVIIALTSCYPVHGEKVTGSDAMEIWKDGEVQAREGVTKALILYQNNLHLCYLYMDNDESLVSDCYSSDKEVVQQIE